MNENENMAVQDESIGTEDALAEEIAEEPQDDSLSLEDMLSDDGGDKPEEEQPQSAGGQKEPGYVRSRIDKAVQKAIAETEARLTAQFEERLAPYREQMLANEAQELVRSGKVKDMDTAMELVRYRQGQPQTQTAGSQTGNAGQQEGPSEATKARVNILQHQADKIKAAGGPDVIAEFKNNPDIRMKVISGEMDFHDVAEHINQNGGGKKPPSPMRSPNGASGNQKTPIDSMSDEQFNRLVKRVQGGARYSSR